MQTTPWVEKYRPNSFENIVLENYNRIFLENIIIKNTIPNLLFYGPPGTGKTTTIINLINSYQKKNNCIDKSLVIHLNASDERGIDTIRNNINSFVNSKSLFKKGMKFVILDEVDYMTKNAQSALRYLLQKYNNVCFCLICNYISKIDESLQNEFVRLRFNQLPIDKIFTFLKKINSCEKLNYSQEKIYSLQDVFNSDLRSMINYMQSNQLAIKNTRVIGDEIFKNITILIKNKDLKQFNMDVIKMTEMYNLDIKNIIKGYSNYLIRNEQNCIKNKYYSADKCN